MLFLGHKLIIAEFTAGVLLSTALGVFILVRAHSSRQLALGVYFTTLGINYVPMLVYAVVITRKQSAKAELGDELDDPRRAMAKYRRQSLLLLIPLLVPILAIVQRRSKTRADRGGA